MGFGSILLLILGLLIGVLGIVMPALIENEKMKKMSPSEKENYIYGSINEHLICSHCQTKGFVHAKQAVRTSTSTGKVGGVLKTNTENKTVSTVTQHHCEKCGSTWDI